MGFGEALATFQAANRPQARAGVAGLAIEPLGQVEIPLLFAVLGELEQQLDPPPFQPGIGVGFARQAGEQFLQRLAEVEALAAVEQVEIGVDVGAQAKAAGVGGKLDAFVTIDTQVGKDELRPVLPQVAEIHQPQAVAERHAAQLVDRFGEVGLPLGEPPRLGEQRLEPFQQRILAQVRAPEMVPEQLRQFVLLQQAEQLRQFQGRLRVHPAQCQQRLHGGARVADLGIGQLAFAEQRALAHHHAHQQGLAGLGQLGERGDEGTFLIVEQIGIAFADPGEHRAEVVQVVEGFGKRWGIHGKRSLVLFMHTDTSAPTAWQCASDQASPA